MYCKIRCDKESEKIYNFFWKLKKAQVCVSLTNYWAHCQCQLQSHSHIYVEYTGLQGRV
jgi:hypothetical protein